MLPIVDIAALQGLSGQLKTGLLPHAPSSLKYCLKVFPPLGNLSLLDSVAGLLDLKFLSKDLIFKDDKTEDNLDKSAIDPEILRALPVAGIGGGLGGLLETQPGGLLGRIQGNVPFPPLNLPVSAELRIDVFEPIDESSVPTSNMPPMPEAMDIEPPEDVQGMPVRNRLPRTKVASSAFSVSGNLEESKFCIEFRPQFTELTTFPPDLANLPVATYHMQAAVRLSAGGQTTDWISIGDKYEVKVPAIPIPKVLVLFENPGLTGAAFIQVPDHSPLESAAQLNQILNTLKALLGTASTVAETANAILPLDVVIQALAASGAPTFKKHSWIADLSDHTRRPGFWSDDMWHDCVNSLVLMGPPETYAELFNDEDFDHGHGYFAVYVPDGFIMTKVELPHSLNQPPSDPPGNVEVLHGAERTHDNSWADNMQGTHIG